LSFFDCLSYLGLVNHTFLTKIYLRLCAIVSRDDIANCETAQVVHFYVILNVFVRYFRTVFVQDQICSNVLPELVQSVFTGQDSTLIALGTKSRSNSRKSKPDTRYQIRMSALQYSQRENQLTDLLSPFNSDPRRRTVRVVDDPRAGAFLENESEIRVDSPDLALFYLNTVADHRIIDLSTDHFTKAISVLSLHCFLRFSTLGGRRRLAIVDLGLGERNSHRGELTMPAIGSILLALVQGQKYLPARENYLSQLLKCAMCSSRLTTFMCSFAEKTDDNENIVQLASKLTRARRNARKNKVGSFNLTCNSATFSLSSSHSSGVPRSEIESGSEMSGAETVIFLGPSPSHSLHSTNPIYPSSNLSINSKGHTPFLSPSLRLYDDLCSPPGTSGNESALGHDLTVFGGHCTQVTKSVCNLDDDKRQAIMQWVDTCEPLLSPDDEPYTNIDRPREILSYPLEDIIEQDEESMRESILYVINSDLVEYNVGEKDAGSDEDALERAMAASVSSIRSHDILAKLNDDIAVELDDEKLKRKRNKLVLNCCQNSMMSSGSTVVDWNFQRLGLGREADGLREQQRLLRKELQDAKALIGQIDDARMINVHFQENRILEKRLTACRNHTMFVTTFL
uniref:Kinesin motor domain-containing protein n=1 Tax=Angiostrongylus cantonensis TaxID=6313 RepID=A0A158P8G3_ANGCA